MPESLSESSLLLSIKGNLTVHTPNELLECLLQLATLYIEKGQTQEGADVLAFLMWDKQTPEDIQEKATELWEDLARWICPRVLLDAEDFGRKATLHDLVDYVSLPSQA